MSKYKGVIFDLDGTLLNTIQDLTDAINYSLSKHGFSEVSCNEVMYFTGSGARVLVEKALKKFEVNDENIILEVLKDYKIAYSLFKENNTKPYEGVIKVLNRLKKQKIKLAVLSNKPHEDTLKVVNKYFPNYFDFIFGHQDYPLKPDPTLTLSIVEKFNLSKEEVLFVGDSNIDILTAKNALLDVCGCSYGFRTTSELQKLNPNFIVNNSKELLNLFTNKLDGILLIDKPTNISSQDAITFIKRKLNIDKIGHAGTLDPLATGLLVVLLGNATKLSDYILEDRKTYIAEVTIGKTTSTLDKEGQITSIMDVRSDYDIDGVLNSLKGVLKIKPPIHSAIKVDGKKLYEHARKGKQIEVKEKDMEIYSINRCSDIKYQDDTIIFSFECCVSKGTYIRSICELIGLKLNNCSYMTNLRRIKSGELDIKDASKLEEVESFKIINPLDVLKNKRIVPVKESLLKYINNGRSLKLKETEDTIFLTYENNIKGIYTKTKDGSYEAKRIWK